jgi:hypothetical protein
MSTAVRFFQSQSYTADQEIPEKRALEQGNYVRVAFAAEQPERAELVMAGRLHSVIYYGRHPGDRELAQQHREHYGPVAMTIYSRPAPTAEGELLTLSEWNPAGELIQITRRLVDGAGNAQREEIVDSAGALRGVRRFEYEGTYLARVVYTRADGAEIIELDDR